MVMPEYKRTDIGVIPEDWDVSTIGQFNPFVTSGSRGWADFYAEFGDPFIRITNQSRQSIYLDLEELRFVQLPGGSAEGKRTSLRNDDILISITADIGICSFIDDSLEKPAYINQHIAMVRFSSEQIVPKYVNYFLSSDLVQRLFVARSDTGAKAGMNLDGIRAIKFAKPKLDEQKAIAEALSDVDGLIDGLEALIAKKRALKTATMQQLLTGKIRLPGFGGGKGVRRTEVGEIPQDWGVRRIGSFTDCFAGGTPRTSRSDFWGGEILWMSSGELHGKRIWDVEGRITKLGLVNSSATLFPVGSVLIGLAGQGKTRGTVAVSEVELTTNQSIAAVYPSEEHDTNFLFYFLETRHEHLRSLSTGDGGRGGLRA